MILPTTAVFRAPVPTPPPAPKRAGASWRVGPLRLAASSMLALCGASVTSFPSEARAASCPRPRETRVLEDSGSKVLMSWTFANEAALLSESLPRTAASRRYASWVARAASTDPLVLLRQSKEVHSRLGATEAWDLLIEARVGTIAPVNCLEEFLMNFHDARFPQARKGSEFGAFVTSSADGASLRVHLLGNDALSVPLDDTIDAAVDDDLASGATLEAHLHLHPFCFQEPDIAKLNGACGAPIPSAPDLDFYLARKPRISIVTNGISSLRLEPRDVRALADAR